MDGGLPDGVDGFVVSGVGSVIRDFTITNFDSHGIRVEEAGRVQVDSSTISHNGGAGIRVSEGAGMVAAASSIFAIHTEDAQPCAARTY